MATLAYTAILAPVIGNLISSLLGSKSKPKTNRTANPRKYKPKRKSPPRRQLNRNARYSHPWPTGIKGSSGGSNTYKRLL